MESDISEKPTINESCKNIQTSSIDIEQILKNAEELLKNVKFEELSCKTQASFNTNKEKSLQSRAQNKLNSSLTNSQCSLVTNDENLDKTGFTYSNTHYLNSEISRLREENELLLIKNNKLKYELRSKDQIVDDLKQKIAQMHIEIESVTIGKKKFQVDIESLKLDLERLNGEKSGLYQNIEELLSENDDLRNKLMNDSNKSNEQSYLIEKLKQDNEKLKNESMNVKMRCLKEKEDLIKNLEQIEKDIIQREQNLFIEKYEKILIESCEAIKSNEAKRYQEIIKNEMEIIQKKHENELKNLKGDDKKELINEKQNCERKIKDLELKVKENKDLFTIEKESLENKIKSYENEINDLKTRLNEEMIKSNEKNKEIKAMNKQKFKMIAQIKKANKEKEEYNNMKEKINKQKNDINEINAENKKEAGLKEYQEKSNYESEKIIKLKQANDKLEIEINKLDTLKLQSECDIITYKNELDSKNEELEQLNKRVQNLSDLLKINDSNEDLNQRIKNIEDEILSKQEIYSQLEQNLCEWNTSNELLEQQISSNKDLNEKLNIELINIADQNLNKVPIQDENSLEALNNLEKNKQDFNGKISKLEEEILQCQKLNTELEDNLNQWLQANTILENRIFELQEQNTNLLNEFEIKANDELERSPKFFKNKETLTEFDSFSDLTNILEEKTNNNSQITTDIKLIEDEILKNQELYKQLRENLIEWQKSNSNLENEILEQQSKNNELVLAHQYYESVDIFDKKYSELKNDYEAKLQTIRAENDELKIELNERNIAKLTVSANNENNVEYKINDSDNQLVKSTNLSRDENLEDNENSQKGEIYENNNKHLNIKNLNEEMINLEKQILELQQINTDLNTNLISWQNANNLLENEIIHHQNRNSELNKEFEELVKIKSESLFGEKEILFNKQIDDLNNQIEALSKKCENMSSLEEKIESDNEKISELNIQINQMKAVNEELNNLNELNCKLEELKTKSTCIGQEISCLEESIFEKQNITNQLSENLVEWQKANEHLEQQIIALQQQNSELSNNILTDSRNQDLLEKINSLEKYNEELSLVIQMNKSDKIRSEQNEIEAVQKIEALESSKQELQIQNMDLLCELDSLRAEKEALEVEQQNLSQNKLDLESKLFESSKNIDKLQQIKNESSFNANRNISNLSEFDHKTESNTTILIDKIFQLEQDLALLTDHVDEDFALNSFSVQAVNELVENVSNLKAENSRLQNEIEYLKSISNRFNLFDDSSNEKRQNSFELCRKLDSELVRAEDSSDLLNTKNESNNAEYLERINDLQETITNLNQKLSDNQVYYQQIIKNLEADIVDRQSELSLLNQNLESLQLSKQQLESQNITLSGEVDNLKKENQLLKQNSEELEFKLSDLHEKVKYLDSQIFLKDKELYEIKSTNSPSSIDSKSVNDDKEEIELSLNKQEFYESKFIDLNNQINELNLNIKMKDEQIVEFKSQINNLNLNVEDNQIQNSLLTNMVQKYKLIIHKLEDQSKRMNILYENIMSSQRRLISRQDKRYNDVLHSLIDSFEDLEPDQIDNKVQEIESDLNNLVQILNNIKDNDLEKPTTGCLNSPYSLKSFKQFISQQSSPIKCFHSVNSLVDECEMSSQIDSSFNRIENNDVTNLLLMVKKCDAGTQCDIKSNYQHSGSLRLGTDFNEINNLQDLIANYLNLIKNYKSLLVKLDAVNVDNSELRLAYSSLNDEFLKLKKYNVFDQITEETNQWELSNSEQIQNLKAAYQSLYSLFQHHKSQSIISYNKLHSAFINLIELSDKKLRPKSDYLEAQSTQAENDPCLPKQYQELSCYENASLKSEIDKLDTRLQTEELKNEVLKQKLKDYEIQIELSSSKINVLNSQIELKENEFKEFKFKIDQIESAKDKTIEKLTKKNDGLVEECELLKSQLSSLRHEKNELESNVEDLKRTLKLTEKESQYNLKLDLMHIRAKLLTPNNEELAIGADGKPLKAILPPLSQNSSTKSNSSLNSTDKADILNDFAIDITHIEKMVQDSDSIILEKKPLDGVQSCLKSLRDQMSELQTQVYEQARESSTWRYKLGFTCEKCEMKWEIEHQVRDSKNKLDGDDEFLESSVTQQIPKCNCTKLNEENETNLN